MSDAHSTSVILDGAIDKLLDYSIPAHLKGKVDPGMRVLVPVKNSLRKGTIFSLHSHSHASLKPISELLSEKALLPPDLMQLASWMATYYITPLRKIIQIMLPPAVRQGKKEKKQLYIRSLYSQNQLRALCEEIRINYPPQAAIIDTLLYAPQGLFLSELLEKANVSKSPIDSLVKKRVIECLSLTIDRTPLLDLDFFPTEHKQLSQEQQCAFDLIKKNLHDMRFTSHLLHGVTGSGKTEIYLQAIDETLKLGKGVIFLVPEIALTSQTIERLKGRFKEKIVLLHHRLSQGERLDTWKQIAEGKAPIVIGARSALFSPLPNLGLVIVDEEHDSSYKQGEEMPCYHARDVAVVRAKMCKATIILGSATPSLESVHNANQGKYQLSSLKERPSHAKLPRISIVDMKKEQEKNKNNTLFSDQLLQGIKTRFSKGEQTLLFLNRRGYHTSKQCRKCGHLLQCAHCDVSLTFHRSDHILACHLCDYQLLPPRSCPKCKEEGHLKYKGAGTELVESQLYALFPELRILRLDADTTRHKGSHEKLYKQFRSGKADLLIGTQMIAKGLHFPSVTLVGILNIDSTLNIPDFRATENAFQLLTQVAGRAGRGDIPGEVIIQTLNPDHPTIIQAATQNITGFYQTEMESRHLFSYPPFTHLVKITFIGKEEKEIEQTAIRFRNWLIQTLPSDFQLLPVIPCGHAKIKDHYRFQFLIKGEKITPLLPLLPKWPQHCPIKKGIRLIIDIDPLSTFF